MHKRDGEERKKGEKGREGMGSKKEEREGRWANGKEERIRKEGKERNEG
jgi:hypothetical protein